MKLNFWPFRTANVTITDAVCTSIYECRGSERPYKRVYAYTATDDKDGTVYMRKFTDVEPYHIGDKVCIKTRKWRSVD